MDLDRQKVLAWLRENVSEHRLQHILGVEKMAAQLAQLHGLDVAKASQAGLLHDLAKFFPPQKLLSLARTGQLEIDDVCAQVPHLLHADVSALVAQQEFNVQDPEILQAIANHTLGQPQMQPLSSLIFIADALEPGRGDSKQLRTLRQYSQANLEKTVWKLCDYTLKYLIKHQKSIHPRMIATRNWALKVAR